MITSIVLSVALLLSSVGIAYAITTKEKLANEKDAHSTLEESYNDAENAVSEAREAVEKAEKELVDANEAYGKAEEKAALAQSELDKAKENAEEPLKKLKEAKEELDKQKKILADAEARLEKVKTEIAEGEKAVEEYRADPENPEKKAAYEAALAKNDEWAEELDAAQQALNTIKADNYLEDAQTAYDKAAKEADSVKKDLDEKQKAFDDANKELKDVAQKAEEAQENMDKAAKALLDAKEELQNATDKLDNNNSNIEDLSNKQAIKFPPKGQDIVVKQGENPLASDAIANKEELPEGTVFTWKEDIDTQKAGIYEGTVVVDYPDFSNDEITVNVTVESSSEEPTTGVEEFTIKVDPNGGNWDGVTDIMEYTVEKGKFFTLPNAPKKEGYTFMYWQGSKYQPGDQYKVEGNHTFTAVWKKNEAKPNTGDNAMPYVYALGLLTAASAMFVLRAKKAK